MSIEAKVVARSNCGVVRHVGTHVGRDADDVMIEHELPDLIEIFGDVGNQLARLGMFVLDFLENVDRLASSDR